MQDVERCCFFLYAGIHTVSRDLVKADGLIEEGGVDVASARNDRIEHEHRKGLQIENIAPERRGFSQ